MSSRCGCPDCVEHRSGCGVDVEYTREDQCDIYTYRFDGECVAGDGLWWDGSQLNVKLRPDGGLSFDNNGALQLADEPDCTWPATVCALEGRKYHQDVVVGALGAGYMYRPQSTHAAFDYAARKRYDAVHVPITMTADGTPVVVPNTHLDRQNGHATPEGTEDPAATGAAPPPPPWAEIHPLDPSGFWRNPQSTRGDYARFWNPDVGRDNDANLGWFGYGEHPEKSLVMLSDVFDRLDGRTVLFLHLTWPATNADGTAWLVTDPAANPPEEYPRTAPPDSRVLAFERKTLDLIESYGLHRSVLVFSRPTIPTENPEIQRDTLARYANSGVTVAPYLATQADVDSYPPSTCHQNGWDWVVMSTVEGIDPDTGRPIMTPPERMLPYSKSGLYGLWWQITRHTEWSEYMAGSYALGAFSSDPDYTRGGIPTGKHCADCGDTSYRKQRPEWNLGHIEHGWLPLVEDAWFPSPIYPDGAQHPNARGHQQGGDETTPTGEYMLDKRHNREDGTYFVLQGYLELDDPERYRIRTWLNTVRGLSLLTERRDVHAEVAFAMTSDGRFVRWDASNPDNHGYVLSYNTYKRALLPSVELDWHAEVNLWVWNPALNDGNGGTLLLKQWRAPKAWLDNGYIGVEIHVNPDRIWVAPVDRTTWQTLPDLTIPLGPTYTFEPYDSSTDTVNGHLGRADSGNRGRSVFFGRGHGPGADDAGDAEEARFANWEALPGEHTPPPYPPPATVAGPDEPDRRSVLQIVRDAVDGDPET